MNSDDDDEVAAAGAADAATPSPVELVDVTALPPAGADEAAVVRWSASNQLQTNVVTFAPHAGIDWHVEAALDVTLTVLVGTLTLRHGPAGEDASVVTATAPAVVVVRAGTRRSLSAGPAGATLLTAHRARAGLLPRPLTRSGTTDSDLRTRS